MKVAFALVALALAFALGRYTSGSSKREEAPNVLVVAEQGLLGVRSVASLGETDQSGAEEMADFRPFVVGQLYSLPIVPTSLIVRFASF